MHAISRRLWLGLAILLVASSAGAQMTVTTSGGTTASIPIFTGSSTLGNSPIMVSNGNVGIGTTSPTELLTVSGLDGQPATTGTSQNGVFRIQVPDGGNGYGETLDMGMHVGVSGPPSYAWLQATNRGTLAVDYNMSLNPNGGNVGIGTASPSAKLEVDGNIKLTSGSGGSITFPDGTVQSTAYTGVACGGDYAEQVNVTGDRRRFEPGDVLVVDPNHPGQFLKSATPYSTAVAGVYSTKPGFVGHAVGMPKTQNQVPMAMLGIVPTKVTAANGPIHPGDLLVTSSRIGYAMRGTDRSRLTGAVIGKALGNLSSGTGKIEVLVTLQ